MDATLAAPLAYPLIRNRSGALSPFDAARIARAIARAGAVSGEFGPAGAARLAEDVALHLTETGAETVALESIQDTIERRLLAAGYLETARRYIAYRLQRHRNREDQRAVVDAVASLNDYLERRDWRVKANANQGYSLGGLILNGAGKLSANYWLTHIYPPEIAAAHQSAAIHIHDLDMLAGYCAGWSLRVLLEEGFNGVAGRVEAAPPRHLSSAVGQMVNFLGTLQNEWAGAQAFSSFDTYLAPFLRKDRLGYEEICQCLQEFVYNLNVPSRWGGQTPFTNVTFDWVCPEDLRAQHPRIGGEEMPFTYGELGPEMEQINRAYIEVMTEGDAKGRVFTFPIPTYNVTEDFPWESENATALFAMAARYGLPYFQNFLNSDLKPHMIRSMCCRLQLDLRELAKRGNGLFGSAEQTGSIGVVTINCAQLGYLFRDDREGLFAQLDHLLELARNSLEIKRKTIARLMAAGLYPYTQRYLGTLRNHFSTIGVNGVNEMIRNFTRGAQSITTPAGHRLAAELLDHVRCRLLGFQQETGHLYNLEATPAEGATYRFAKEDRKRFPAILQAGTAEKPYYTNSTQLPVGFTTDPFEALQRQEDLQRKYTGGTVLHLYLGEPLASASACRDLVRRALSCFRLPYITVTPTFSICPEHGYLPGEHKNCPHCARESTVARECEVWTRVMGYHRPVSSFNIGKQGEHEERRFFRP